MIAATATATRTRTLLLSSTAAARTRTRIRTRTVSSPPTTFTFSYTTGGTRRPVSSSSALLNSSTSHPKAKQSLLLQHQSQHQYPDNPFHQTRTISTTTSARMSSYKTTDLTSPSLLSLLSNRRSYYALDSTSPIPNSTIKSIITSVLDSVPSAFNSQTTRLVLAVGPAHHKIWDLIASLLRKHMGEQRWAEAPTSAKIAGFRAAYGTVLFYEDSASVESYAQKFQAYRDKFPQWSEHTSGMHQLAVWTALEAEGFGANLQHYNGLQGLEEGLAKEFGTGPKWLLKAQMVFGGVEDGKRPDPKDKKSTGETLKVFGMD